MKDRSKKNCHYFHINSMGQKKSIKCYFSKSFRFLPLKNLAFKFFRLYEARLPKGRWMLFPQKPISASSKMARGVAAGRASRGSLHLHFWLTLYQCGCMYLSSNNSENDKTFACHLSVMWLLILWSINPITCGNIVDKITFSNC